MSKERLERIKERVNYHGHLDDDIDWLIKQAERVQELEDIIYKDERQAVLESMYEQNKRYREVIKKAIDDLENECLWDALVALEELEENNESR